MELCLVRHAIAGERDSRRYPDDSLRPLTPAGAEKMKGAAKGLAKLFTPEAIMSSPLLRAKQTAEILLVAYGLEEIVFSVALATGDNARLAVEVAALRLSRVIAVGHEPHLSGTLSEWVSGSPGRMSATFKKGAAALIVFEGPAIAGEGRLEWLVQPAVLRALGEKQRNSSTDRGDD